MYSNEFENCMDNFERNYPNHTGITSNYSIGNYPTQVINYQKEEERRAKEKKFTEKKFRCKIIHLSENGEILNPDELNNYLLVKQSIKHLRNGNIIEKHIEKFYKKSKNPIYKQKSIF